jgi:hypothetical protein
VVYRTGFSAGGDSGSLIVVANAGKGKGKPKPESEDALKPVGLLFAGSFNGLYTFANPIDDVLSRFGVTIDGD